MPIAFSDCEVDEELYQLRRAGRVVKIEPKVFDVLLFLIRSRERVVSKLELLDAIWPGEAVSESVLPRCIAAARRAIGDDRTRQKLIQTVHGRGYRFVAEIGSPASGVGAPDAAPEEPSETPLFVGREGAMRRLHRALDEALRSRGSLLLLVGEPGIGKTRTAEQLAAAARERAARVLVGRCYEGEGAPAYWPWVQLLRSCLAAGDEASLAADLGPGVADLAQLVPELRADSEASAAAEPIEGEQARFRLFDSVARFLERRAARQPLVLVLDDLHWADADSLLLLQFLASALRAAPILVVGTYRDIEVRRGHPLGSLLGALAREPHCERIRLHGLSGDEVRLLIEGVAGETTTAEVAGSVYDMTEGNPFFVREMAHLLSEEGRLGGDDSAQLSFTLPQSVRDAIGRRLAALSAPCNELLRVASVLGREFGSAVLEEVSGLSGGALLETLGEAVDAQLVNEAPGALGQYAFGHALTRHTLYEELSVPQRVGLHRRVGEALERLAGDGGGALLSELAHHFFQAAPGGDVERAIDYSVRSATRAHELFAYDESVRHYERALEALELRLPIDEAERCRLMLARAEELWAAGDRARSRAGFVEAAELARRLGETDLLARAAVGLRGYGESGMTPEPETVALLEEALGAVGEDRPLWRSRVLARLSSTAPYSRSMENRALLSREAYELALRVDDRAALSDSLGARYWATLGPDRVRERLEVGREAVARGTQWGERRLRLMGHEAQIGAYLLLGDLRAADREIDAYETQARELRQPLFLFLTHTLRGSQAMNQGRFGDAETHFTEAAAIGRGTVGYADALYAGTVYWLHSMRGDFRAFSEVETLLREMFEEDATGIDSLLQAGVAHARLARGDAEGARRILHEVARRGFERIEHDEHWLMSMSALSDLVTRLDEAEHAAVLHELLLPYEPLTMTHDLIRAVAGSVATTLGALAGTMGRYAEGVEHFERGMERERAMGLRPALFNSMGGLAQLLMARRAAGDEAQARALVEQADRGAASIGSLRRYTLILDGERLRLM